MLRRMAFVLGVGVVAAAADSLPVPIGQIPRGTVLSEQMLRIDDVAGAPVDALRDLAALVGQQARRALPAGRPVHAADVGAPIVIKRNDTVTMIFDDGSMQISTTGRALAQGGIGDAVAVMNLGSRKTVTGIVMADGTVNVTPHAANQLTSESPDASPVGDTRAL